MYTKSTVTYFWRKPNLMKNSVVGKLKLMIEIPLKRLGWYFLVYFDFRELQSKRRVRQFSKRDYLPHLWTSQWANFCCQEMKNVLFCRRSLLQVSVRGFDNRLWYRASVARKFWFSLLKVLGFDTHTHTHKEFTYMKIYRKKTVLNKYVPYK